MTFNWSAVNIYVRPGNKPGENIKVFLDPQNNYFRLVNKAKTVDGVKNTIKVSLSPSQKEGVIEDITITGQLGLNKSELVIFQSIDKPEIWAGYNLKAFLERRGIKVIGGVRRSKSMSHSLYTLASVESKPIGDHISDMLKFSNNYVAEILTKNLAAEYVKTPATMENGIQVLHDYLNRLGLNPFH